MSVTFMNDCDVVARRTSLIATGVIQLGKWRGVLELASYNSSTGRWIIDASVKCFKSG